MDAINLEQKLASFTGFFQPRVVTQFNGHDVMVAKTKGEFVWHKHDDTDDFFLVLKGRLVIQLRDGDVTLGPGEMYVVPKGVEHRPVADEESTSCSSSRWVRQHGRRCDGAAAESDLNFGLSSRTSGASVGTYGALRVATIIAATVGPDTRSCCSLLRNDSYRVSRLRHRSASVACSPRAPRCTIYGYWRRDKARRVDGEWA
jgi:uncharacterized RmlC-like cupin family protein